MINWNEVGFSAMWIVGLSMVLSGLNMAYYTKGLKNWSTLLALRAPFCRIMIGLGMVLFCIGLAGSVSALWEHIVWIVLAFTFALQTLQKPKTDLP